LTDKRGEIAVLEAARESIPTFGSSHPRVLDLFGYLKLQESMSWPRVVMGWNEVKARRIIASAVRFVLFRTPAKERRQ
jgi:hypothetical protein